VSFKCGTTASSRNTPERTVRQSSDIEEKLSPWPEVATNAERMVVGGFENEGSGVVADGPIVSPVRGSLLSGCSYRC
jgi:hypothetical protein